MTSKRYPWREFWILWGLGIAGPMIFIALVRTSGAPFVGVLLWRFHPRGTLSWGIALVEIALELSVCVGVGLFAAHRIGLGAPILERILQRDPVGPNLRSLLLPSVLGGIIVGMLWIVPDMSFFHPNRKAEIRFVNNSYQSEPVRKLLESFPVVPLTRVSLAASSLASAIDAELTWRLFLLSLIALTLARISGAPEGMPNPWLLRSAIFAVAMISTSYYLAWQWSTHQMVLRSLQEMQAPHDPFWLIATRMALRTVPADLAFGWLYIRRGIESAILGSLLARVVQHLLIVFVLVRFI